MNWSVFKLAVQKKTIMAIVSNNRILIIFHFAHSAKKILEIFRLFQRVHPKMSGAQSALFNFEMSGAHDSLRFWECTREWRS